MRLNQRLIGVILIVTFIISLAPGSTLAQPLYNGIRQETPPPPTYQTTADYKVYIPAIFQPLGGHPVFGVEMETVSDGTLLDLASRAGVNWVRRNGVFWHLIEPVEGVRDWSVMAALESEMIVLSQNEMQMVLIVRGVPEWAQTADGYICGPIAQSKFAAFASFMRELVSRYSQPPYNVRYWEIGNEPDASFISESSPFGCWGDLGDSYYGGGYYGEMLKVIYPQIKAADPNAQVLVGGLLMDCDPVNPPSGKNCTSSKFLEGILRAGAGSAFDGVSFHSYDYYNGILGSYGNSNWHGSSTTTGPILDLKANFLYSVLQQYGYSDRYLMTTETALLCNDAYQTCEADYESTKAMYIAQSYTKSLLSGVSASIWYSYTNPWRFTSLIESSIPKPAYYSYLTASQLLQGTTYKQKVSIDGLAVYEFEGRGKRVWIAWSLDGQPHQVSLPVLPIKMWDLFGNSIPPSRDLSIELRPVYLEWDD